MGPEAVEQARIRLQNLMQSALQLGTLDTVVNGLLARESGSHGASVSEVAGHGPSVSEADGHVASLHLDNSNALQAKERIRQLLVQGLQDGTLDGVLCRFHGYANPQINASRDRMVQVLEQAAADGALEAALDACAGQSCMQNEDTRKHLHCNLHSEIQNGRIQQPLNAESEQRIASHQASQGVQVARELREGFEQACRDGQLEKQCSDLLRPPSVYSMQEQPDLRLPRPPGPDEPRPPVRRSYAQNVVSVREQLEDLKTENERLREKVDKMEKVMQEEEKRRREATLLPPAL